MNTGECSFPDCGRTRKANGLCQGHEQQRRKGRDLTPIRGPRPARCGFDSCGRPAFGLGYCQTHYKQEKSGRPLRPIKGRLQRGRRTSEQVLVRDEVGHKHCVLCDRWLPESSFSPRAATTADGFYPHCKQCVHVSRHSMAWLDFTTLLARQGGRCAICLRGPGAGWQIDHDHQCCKGEKSCGRCVRGILCRNCNMLLGSARDDVRVLSAARDYLGSFTLSGE